MIERLRVLHVTHDMNIGGTEQVIRTLVAGLDKSCYECGVVCLDGKVGPLGQAMSDAGTVVHKLHRRPGFDRLLIMDLRTLIRQHSYDIVHCHQYTPYTYGVLASLGLPCKVIFTEHGRFHPDRYSWKRRLLNPFLARCTDAITAISSATRAALANYEWFPKQRIAVIYNGVEFNTASNTEHPIAQIEGITTDHVVLGTISRFDSIKNLSMMIEAFAQVSPEYPHCRLLLVGDGPEMPALRNLVSRLELDEMVCFTGFTTEPRKYLQRMDFFLLSSFSEGTSMTLLEAMAEGKSCVVTAVGGNVEIVKHGTNGLLVESGKTGQFAQSIVSLLSDSELAAHLAANARDICHSPYHADQMVAAYEALYEELHRQ